MKLVAEYLLDAIKFEQMAEDAKDEALKAAFMNQAADYRKPALKRASSSACRCQTFHRKRSGTRPVSRFLVGRALCQDAARPRLPRVASSQ
jgi:hypothetical protein